ncbi:MAG: hypothetical protein V2I27_10810 [Erythrobacter sp.]|jgi:hypothetical protein|nr:hypothetical protein [Erythrobacter sp.]
MLEPPSLLSLFAAALYGLVVLVCLLAMTSSISGGQRRWHSLGWLMLGILFLGCAAARMLGLEEFLRDSLRDVLRTDGAYGSRRDLQSMLIAALLVLGATISCWLGYRSLRAARCRRDLIVMVALAAGGAMIALLMLRLISLHWIDVVLFGPLKINWFADLGLSCTVLAAAAYYIRRVRSAKLRPRASRSRARR